MATSTTLAPKMTVQKLRTWFRKNGAEVAKLIKMRKFAADEKVRVAGYEAPLLAEYAFKDADTLEIITATDCLYNTLPEDEARVQEFYERSYDLHAANGWNGERGTCPALVAGYAAIEQEHVLLPLIAEFMGVSLKQLEYNYRVSQEAIDLVVKFYNEQYA